MKLSIFITTLLFLTNFLFGQIGGITGSRSTPVVSSSPDASLITPSLPLIFEENMDNIALLEPGGWIFNDVDGHGNTTYFQGNTSVFSSYNGEPTSYLGQNFNGAYNGDGLIDQWLITPVIHCRGATTFSFMANSVISNWEDHIYIYYSPTGSSNLDQFVLLRDRTEVADGWNQYTETVNSNRSIRFAIRYYETDGGFSGTDSDYWGLDNVQVYGTPTPVPISIWWISGAFLLIFIVIMGRRLF